MIWLLVLSAFLFAQSPYKGLIYNNGQVIDCSYVLNRYAHSGVPSVKEDRKVKLCCSSLRKMLRNGEVNELLVAHLNVCRQLGR